jgi:signal transduction histidine kinase
MSRPAVPAGAEADTATAAKPVRQNKPDLSRITGGGDRHGRPGLVIWWHRRSLRARLTLTAAAGLAVALAGAAVLLAGALGVALNGGLDNSARQTAQEVAALADANRLPNPVPVAAGTAVVQVLDAHGRIIGASAGADRLVPLLPPAQATAAARSRGGRMLDGRPYALPEFLRVVAVSGRRGETVIAAVSYEAVSDSLVTVTHALLFGTPALLLLMTWVSWLITGSTLRPIAALRRGAEEVTATGVPRGLPVPEARDEVHSLAVTLNDMLSRLDAAQQRQRRLVSDTAHELRSPIASIRAQLEVALDHPDSQEWEQTARDVLADTLRLARLAEDLLVLARLEERAGQAGDRGLAAARATAPATGGAAAAPAAGAAAPAGPGQRPPDGGTVDLADLAAGTVAGYAQARVPASVSADAPGPCRVTGDAEGLRRMLVNLIDNALRYARSQVTVAVSAGDGWALVTVTDDGPGIAPENAERAFDRFTTLDDARARSGDDAGGGAGLGLAIVRATAIAHGGTAWLEDAGPGLRAAVRLPLAGAAGERPSPHAPPGGMASG